jgi:hypothetical protein
MAGRLVVERQRGTEFVVTVPARRRVRPAGRVASQ